MKKNLKLLILLALFFFSGSDCSKKDAPSSVPAKPYIDFMMQNGAAWGDETFASVRKIASGLPLGKTFYFGLRLKGPALVSGPSPEQAVKSIKKLRQQKNIEVVLMPNLVDLAWTQYNTYANMLYPADATAGLKCHGGGNVCNLCAPVDLIRYVNFLLKQEGLTQTTSALFERERACFNTAGPDCTVSETETCGPYDRFYGPADYLKTYAAGAGVMESSPDFISGFGDLKMPNLKIIAAPGPTSAHMTISNTNPTGFLQESWLQMYDLHLPGKEFPVSVCPTYNKTNMATYVSNLLNYRVIKNQPSLLDNPNNYLMFSYNLDSKQNFNACNFDDFSAFVTELRKKIGPDQKIGIWDSAAAFKAWGLPFN